VDRFGVLIIAATIVMIWLLYYYYRKGFSTFARIPAKAGAQIIDGEIIRVKGIVQVPGKSLVAPLSGRVCALYHVIVTQYWKRAQTGDLQGYRIEETKAGDLVMLCEDGTWVVIDAKSSDNNVGNEYNGSYDFWSLDKDALKTFLRIYRKKYDPAVALGERIETSEKVIIAGDLLWAAGKAEWRDAQHLTFALPVGKYLYIEAPPGTRVKIRNYEVY
jgi:hypothetical protein